VGPRDPRCFAALTRQRFLKVASPPHWNSNKGQPLWRRGAQGYGELGVQPRVLSSCPSRRGATAALGDLEAKGTQRPRNSPRQLLQQSDVYFPSRPPPSTGHALYRSASCLTLARCLPLEYLAGCVPITRTCGRKRVSPVPRSGTLLSCSGARAHTIGKALGETQQCVS